MNEAWRLLILFVFSVAGILLAGRLRSFDSFLSLFLSGGFIGTAVAHSDAFAPVKEILWVPALALMMAVPLRASTVHSGNNSIRVGSIVMLNGAHTLIGAGLAALFKGQEAYPLVLWGFAVHELIHKAALVSLLRSLGYSTRLAMLSALLSALFVFGAWLLAALPAGVLEWTEVLVTLGLAWMGLSHLTRAFSRSGNRSVAWHLWLPALAGFTIFALWH